MFKAAMIASLALATFSAAAFAQPPRTTQERLDGTSLDRRPDQVPPQVSEAIYGAIAAKQTFRIRVSSNGCTKKQDFQVIRRQKTIEFIRRTRDRCRSFAMGSTWLDFTYGELGVQRGSDFMLANPLAAWTGPGD